MKDHSEKYFSFETFIHVPNRIKLYRNLVCDEKIFLLPLEEKWEGFESSEISKNIAGPQS